MTNALHKTNQVGVACEALIYGPYYHYWTLPTMSQIPAFNSRAGAAFLLSEPASFSLKFDHPEGRVVVRDGAANVSVGLLETPNAEEVKAVAWRVIQESFDLIAARRQAALSTKMGESECVFWLRKGNQYDVSCVVTIDSKWSIGAQGTVGNTEQAASGQTFIYHESLRFYRMSQCAPGLYEAYRNAYLALECLVSRIDRKKSDESEQQWLKRVIANQLKSAVPSGINVDKTIKQIYKDGRNPLFHAKLGEIFYPPHGEEREKIQKLVERLMLLLVSLLQHRLGRDVVRKWASMSQSAQDAQTRAILDFDEVCFERSTPPIKISMHRTYIIENK